MKDNITSREDIFLAKIAGKDVDIKTMTPPVATSMTEKLMLEIAERIDNIESGSGGGGVTYETLAELSIGQMESRSGGYLYVIDDIEAPDLDTTAKYYLNTPDIPSNIVINEEGSLIIMFNTTDPEHPTPVDSNKPVVGVSWEEHQCAFYSTEDRFSNTTVKILKKVSGSSTGSGVKTIHATAIPPEQEGGDTTLDVEETEEEAREIVFSGEPVVLKVMVPTPLGYSTPAYGLMTNAQVFGESEHWFAVFNLILGASNTELEIAEIVIGRIEGDGFDSDVNDIKYDFSPKVVKVDFVVDYVNKTLISASHTPAEVVELVENGTWVYGYDSARGLYGLRQMKKEGTATRVGFDNQFGDDCTIDTDENGSWEFNAK